MPISLTFFRPINAGAGGGHQVFLAPQPISARLRGSPTPQDPHADGGRAEVLRCGQEQAPFREVDRYDCSFFCKALN